MYRTVLWTLRERERVGKFGRMALKHVNIMYEMSCQSRFDAGYRKLGAGDMNSLLLHCSSLTSFVVNYSLNRICMCLTSSGKFFITF